VGTFEAMNAWFPAAKTCTYRKSIKAEVPPTILLAILAKEESDDTRLVSYLGLKTLITKVLATNHLGFSLYVETCNASFFV
jgi:hypothetical protein